MVFQPGPYVRIIGRVSDSYFLFSCDNSDCGQRRSNVATVAPWLSAEAIYWTDSGTECESLTGLKITGICPLKV